LASDAVGGSRTLAAGGMCGRSREDFMGYEWGHYLDGGLEHVLFFHILGIILPTD